MLTDKNIDISVIKNVHSKKSSIARQMIIQLNKSKATLFGLHLKRLKYFKTKALLNIVKTLKKVEASVHS